MNSTQKWRTFLKTRIKLLGNILDLDPLDLDLLGGGDPGGVEDSVPLLLAQLPVLVLVCTVKITPNLKSSLSIAVFHSDILISNSPSVYRLSWTWIETGAGLGLVFFSFWRVVWWTEILTKSISISFRDCRSSRKNYV